MSNRDEPLKLNAKEKQKYYKWLYWKQGIPARQFRQEFLHDIVDIVEIQNAMNERQKSIDKLNSELMNL